MPKEFPELPPSLEDIDIDDSAQSDEVVAEYSRSDYEGWWGRASDLYKYINKVPDSLTNKVSMTERKSKLIYGFDQLVSPEGVTDPVPEGEVRRLKSWIDHAEGFVGFLLQSYEPSAPITQAPILVEQIQENEWQWPWIEGWDNPKKRKKILSPAGKEDSQIKRFLIGGAVLGGALYLGKRFIGGEE